MVLIYVPIKADAFDRRDLLRRTVLSDSFYTELVVKHVFVVGFTSTESVQQRIEMENATHSDILQSTISDAYQFLVVKNLLFWNWFAENCYHAEFVLKMDSDVFINPFRLTDLVLEMDEKQRDWSITGFVYPQGAL